ncbi:MAG: hypothetical protein H6561_22375 [Lewinellaceae bacterium]|nr:hypothetical protein [Saprospiraceae bacterium]MCB9272288.1 hypothetical protein [Lewinellaceae bacterium]HPG08103.1 hypothetical protein [Saprospiraceae bacterium]HPQ99183.1 hypothetical protein [Saprospiraceae bacterium]HQU51642.1 hypothetical protein [Saprospiraceae bacterium]
MLIDILGRDHFALAVQFDLMRDLFGHLPDIRIIANLETDANPLNHVPFAMPDDRYAEVYIDHWEDDPARMLLLGAMTGKTMKKIFEQFKTRGRLIPPRFLRLAHPSAYIAQSSHLGFGTVIEPLAVVSSFAQINDFVWIKRGATVGHHTVIESFTNINPGVTIASGCHIGEECLIGVGATVSDKVQIGARSIIGAGAMVLKDVPPGKIVIGNPARILRDNDKY